MIFENRSQVQNCVDEFPGGDEVQSASRTKPPEVLYAMRTMGDVLLLSGGSRPDPTHIKVQWGP